MGYTVAYAADASVDQTSNATDFRKTLTNLETNQKVDENANKLNKKIILSGNKEFMPGIENSEKDPNVNMDEIASQAQANAKASDEINLGLKKKRIFKLLANIFGLFSFIMFVVFHNRIFDFNDFPISLNSNINVLEVFVSFTLTIIFGTLYILFSNKTCKVIHSINLTDSEDHQKRSEMLYWYLMLMNETDSKMLYRKVYKDTFTVITELCKDPKIKKKVETIKKELGIDFSYVEEKLKVVEERVKERVKEDESEDIKAAGVEK